MAGCRDCHRCTESCVGKTVRYTFYVVTLTIPWWIEKMINLGAKKCPQCGHPLSWHERDRDGRFAD